MFLLGIRSVWNRVAVVNNFRGSSWKIVAIPSCILFTLIFHLPRWLIDFGVCTNLACSLSIIFWVFSLRSSASARIFPSLLLYLCLLRLGLNLASTRWILSSGWASPLIFALGNFFSLGSIPVALTVCLLLFLVNFLVITKGAERIAEVRARFSLEALPGKQMSLDADIAAGRIGYSRASVKKSSLLEESDYFSAMEGVFRFVKGDAIMSWVLLGVNILAALFLGRATHVGDLWLTVLGDALVSQIPALLTSCAAATLIAKVGEKESLAQHLLDYYEQSRQSFLFIALILCGMACIPGAPKALILGFSVLLFLGYRNPSSGETLLFQKERVEFVLPDEGVGNPANLYKDARNQIYQELGVVFPEAIVVRYVTGSSPRLIFSGQEVALRELSCPAILESIRQLAPETISERFVAHLVDEFREHAFLSIEEILPLKISENSLIFLLRALVRERVSLHLFPKILEAIDVYGSQSKNSQELVECVRKYLGKQIGLSLWNRQDVLEVITIDSLVEQFVRDSQEKVVLDLNEKVVAQVKHLLRVGEGNFRAIVTGSETRKELKRIVDPYFPDLLVLAHSELPEEIPITLLGAVSDEVLLS
ncbi:type III secretion system protein [Chlamydia trachomatis]|nr:type III secretion system protein [Chlamydia trachomatis E/SotonE4]CPR43544.1 type III secretion system protein [Chlamydia trachomatis]